MLIDPGVLSAAAKHVMQTNELAMTLELSEAHGATLVARPKRTVQGEKSSVDTPSEPATLHTHSVWNYRNQVCFVGWPSGEDMRWILKEAIEQAGAFRTHLCVALEGTYAVTTSPRVHALAALPEEQLDVLFEEVFEYFSSRHGHRCGRGAVAEKFPCALYFMRLAARFSFGRLNCEQFAGEPERCKPRSAARVAAARLVPGRVFTCTFVPHRLQAGDTEYRYSDLRDAPEAHRRRIKSGAYTGVRVTGAERVRLDRA